MSQAVIGQIAGAIAFISFIPYLVSIIRKETKPARATFAIWSFVDTAVLLSYFASGARATIWVALTYALFQFIIFGLSLKYGVGGTSRFDIICLIAAALGMVLWALTDNPQTGLYLSIFAESVGYVILIKKSYDMPETEAPLAWIIGAFGAFINLFAIASFKPEIYLYPVVVFVFDVILVATILVRRRGASRV